ncbi:cation:proton antiporter [Thiospirochaeta perfilievii]|uniref:Cation:proton antiporter n=1 Tax=Thiospirochaeta perfilievii TaxID=252967 RepID=A0A5C1Q7A7_9SPIO|nr:sodium:proton antiporter [Thiospirochaeta perfilievii]QEN03905.1 cation:proton antiporter [Thiospirochaeta perfilievii]
MGSCNSKNLIKIFISLSIAETGVNLLFLAMADFAGKKAPIISDPSVVTGFADPLPHALILTSIVIGTAVTALGLTVTARYFGFKGTLDISLMKELKN